MCKDRIAVSLGKPTGAEASGSREKQRMQALRMTADERLARWKSNYAHISVHTAQMWADHFITELNETCSKALKRNTLQPTPLDISAAADQFLWSRQRLVVIGYNAALTAPGAAPPGTAGPSLGRFDRTPHMRRNRARCGSLAACPAWASRQRVCLALGDSADNQAHTADCDMVVSY